MTQINPAPQIPAVYAFNAIIESTVVVSSSESPCAPLAVQLAAGQGRYDAETWLSPEMFSAPADKIAKASITLIGAPAPRGERLILVAARSDTAIEVLPLIPYDACPIAGAVSRTSALVDHISTAPLRRFVDNVFSLRDVCFNFWTCPGSLSHHHAYRGGLADHSIEVAELVANNDGLGSTERDIGIAYALLHDVGKLWSYTPSAHLTQKARRLGHELICLEKLQDAFAALDGDWEDAATALRSLLSGLWKRDGGRPLIAIGQVVRAFDQMSAERERIVSARESDKPWAPARWGG